MAAPGFWMLDAGYWVLDTGFWILGSGYWVLDAGCWILDAGFWVLDTGFWTSIQYHSVNSSPPLRKGQNLRIDVLTSSIQNPASLIIDMQGNCKNLYNGFYLNSSVIQALPRKRD
jgi:hypothetical protein